MRGYNLSTAPRRSRRTGCATCSGTSAGSSSTSGSSASPSSATTGAGSSPGRSRVKHPELLERLVICDAPPPSPGAATGESPRQREAVQLHGGALEAGARTRGDARRRTTSRRWSAAIGRGHRDGSSTSPSAGAYREAWSQPRRAHRRAQLLPRGAHGRPGRAAAARRGAEAIARCGSRCRPW